MKLGRAELMVEGHEIWIEELGIEEGNVELALFYGHNMRQDGVVDPEKLTSIVYSPEEDKEILSIVTTDKNGIANVPIACEGEWIF